MNKQKFCKNQDEFPDTHFFSYRNQNFPFKSDFFKISSKYFSREPQLLEKTQQIPLLSKPEEANIDLTDENINTFIKYVQHKKIQITNENVVSLSFLAKKYEVSSLLSVTDSYISEHHQELVLQLLTVHQNDTLFDTSLFENILSENLPHYIKEEQLLALKVPILYRILEKSKLKNDSKEMFDFLFKCLKKYGREASSLFKYADFGSARSEYLNRLLNEYSEIFDFHFINSEMMKSFYEQKNEIIRIKEENRIVQEEAQKRLKDEIDAIRSEFAQQLTALNKKHCDEIGSLKLEMKKSHESMQSTIDKMKKNIEIKDGQIKTQEQIIKKVMSDNEDVKSRLLEVEIFIEKAKQEEELRRKQEEHYYVNGHEFEGIFDYLSKECGGNPHLKGIIDITSSGDEGNNCYDLIDKQFDKYFYPHRNPNSYVQFDFKQYKVSIKNYSLKNNQIGANKLINWEIVGSNNGQNWQQIDERHIKAWDGTYDVSTYSTRNEDFYRYVRICLKGKSSSNKDYLLLSSIEFFGKLTKRFQ